MLILLSAFLPYFLGLGLLTHLISPSSFRDLPRTNDEVASYLATNIIIGIISNHLLVMLISSIKISLIVGTILSFTGILVSIVILRKSFYNLFRLGMLNSFVLLLTTLLFGVLIIINQPGWDARFIWFFHGKMIYYNNALNQYAGWSNPAISFSHADYPKLIGILSAQFAYLIGFWNDYLPRLSLLVLLVPAILGTLSFFKRINISSIYLYIIYFYSLDSYMFNGYMDAYFAIHAGISLLYYWKWTVNNNYRDLLTAICFLSIASLLKNEGILYFTSFVLSASLCLIKYKNIRIDFMALLKVPVFWVISIILSTNLAYWAWLKNRWGLKNDLSVGINSFAKAATNLINGSFYSIIKYLILDTYTGLSILILVSATLFSIYLRVYKLKHLIMSYITTIFYFMGIFVVYLSTPLDLTWHLQYSASRTMMAVNLCLIASTYITLRQIEDDVG